MKGHAFTAYLRVYQPLAAFPPRERADWAAYVEAGQALPASLLVGREERRGLARALGLAVGTEREHALVERVGDVVYLCPLRTELRTLQSLVALHVPLPWFALFEAGDRRLVDASAGQPARLTYQTAMAKARGRVSRALAILQQLMEDAEMVVAAEELRSW